MINILYYILQQQHPVYLHQIVSCDPDKVKDRLTFLVTMGLSDLKKNKFDPSDLGFDDFEELQIAIREAIQDEDFSVSDITSCVESIVALYQQLDDKKEINEKILVKETLKPKICAKDIKSAMKEEIKNLPFAVKTAGNGRKKKT